MLGLEPLYLACEGRMVIMAPKTEADKIVEALRQCPYSKDAAIIGEVTADQPGKVVMNHRDWNSGTAPTAGRRTVTENLLIYDTRVTVNVSKLERAVIKA